MRKFTPIEYIMNVGFSILHYSFHHRLLSKGTKEDIQKFQFERFRKLVQFAYANVPLYRRKYDQAGISLGQIKSIHDIRLLPTTTKEDFLAGYPNDVVAKGFNIRNAITSSTSGTTGQFLNILFNGKKVGTYLIAATRIYRMVTQYHPWYRHALIYTSPYPISSLFGLYPIYFISNLEEREKIIRKLKKIKPHIITCYPSVLKEIAELITENDKRSIQPKAIFLNSEMSTQKERDDWEKVFGCKIYDEYSSEELTRIASQCVYKNYHLFEDICYTEILDHQSDEPVSIGCTGEIVGTNLHNFVMPFIRYRQGDIGRIVDAQCKCGSSFRMLDSVLGRKEESFSLPSGRILSSGFLLDLGYAMVCQLKEDVKAYRIIQEKTNSIRIEITPGKDFNEQSRGKILTLFRKAIGEQINIRISTTNKMQRSNIRRKTIVSLVGKD